MFFAKYLRAPCPERFTEENLENGEKKRRLAIQQLICGHLAAHSAGKGSGVRRGAARE
jgi:hypothetical protein